LSGVTGLGLVVELLCSSIASTIASIGTRSEVSWVAETGLHRGGPAEILYRGVSEERKLRVVRIGINASRW
jgi:hypothetical protein